MMRYPMADVKKERISLNKIARLDAFQLKPENYAFTGYLSFKDLYLFGFRIK